MLNSEECEDEVQKVLVVSLEVVILSVEIFVFLAFVSLKLLLLVNLIVLQQFLTNLFKVIDKVLARCLVGQLTGQRPHEMVDGCQTVVLLFAESGESVVNAAIKWIDRLGPGVKTPGLIN